MAKQNMQRQRNFLHVKIAHMILHWEKYVISAFILTYIITLSYLSVSRHNAFASRFDLSNMDQTVYYTLHGHFFSFRFPDEFVSRFAVHADILLILLSPLYLLWDDVRALIISESVFLGLGAIPTYLLAQRVLKNKIISLVITAAYLLNPGMQWTDIYDFHAVSFAIPFLLAAFYSAYTKRWILYGTFTLLALLTKEQIALNIAMTGMVLFLAFKQRLIGAVTILIGLVWFYVMTSIVMPYFSQEGMHWALENYGKATPFSVLLSYVTSPQLFLQSFIIDPKTIEYYILLLKPFGFLPLLGLPWLVISAPDIAINVIRDTKTIQFHYDSGTTPALVIATIFGFHYINKLLKKLQILSPLAPKLIYLPVILLAAFSLRTNYHYSPLPSTPSCWCTIYSVSKEDVEFEKALQSIPKDKSVTASLEVRPHVSHREFAFTVPSATESADFIALITQNRIPGNFNIKEYETELIPILINSNNHRLRFKSEHFYLFERMR